MAFTPHFDPPPLREDASGALRVGESRVLLELVVRAFENGATPESIVQRYSTLSLMDAYAVIAYYLRHRDEVAGYMVRREEAAREIRRTIEEQQPDVSALRARLLARRKPTEITHAFAGR